MAMSELQIEDFLTRLRERAQADRDLIDELRLGTA